MVENLIVIGVICAVSVVVVYLLKLKKEQETVALKQNKKMRIVPIHAYQSLSFEDALNFSKMSKEKKQQHYSIIADSLGEGAQQALEVTKIAVEKNNVVVSFSSKAAKGLKSKEYKMVVNKSGDALPVIRDAKTGKIVEHGKVVGPSTFGKMAKVANLVVSVSHIISGADNAKKLKILIKKVDLLIARQENQLIAELETIYETMQEIDINNLEKYEFTLRQLKQQCKFLRNTWFRNMNSALKDIENPNNVGFLKKVFRNNKSTGQTVANELSSIEAPLHLTRFALELEKDISTVLGEEHVFYNQTIPNQKNKVIELSNLLQERKDWIDNLCLDGGATSAEALKASEQFKESIDFKAKVKLTA
ncbi:MAG: hypothetical protein CME65_12650 [Halobacteriovoraceae bacterium]|nr:hypothetical protein [Halobacteriovoraceae bacterium]|tara:strand:- start:16020 stop:17105 length:1086 start_codon:yes stop_codon:yes gene_type:complete